MRQVGVVLLVVILAAQSLYQLGLFTYFELNRTYIERVLCINRDQTNPLDPEITVCGGKCYLQKQLALAEATTSQEDGLPELSQKVEIPAFIVEDLAHVVSSHYRAQPDHYTPYLYAVVASARQSVFRPPSFD